MNQLTLFDPEQYKSPSIDGQPDWAYDVIDGDEYKPSESKKKDDRRLEQTDRQGVGTLVLLPLSVSSSHLEINQSPGITGDRNSTPGEEVVPGAIVSNCSGGGNLGQTAKGDRHISTDRTGGGNLEQTAKGDRHISTDRTGADQNSENVGMLGNVSGDRSCSIASDSTPLTVEEGKAFWDDLIFGRKTKIPERVAETTPGNFGDRNTGRNDHQRVQSDDSTPDMVSEDSSKSAISSENLQLGDQRKHNGKPGASGWIGRQYKYRDNLGRSRTSSHWIPGSAGPYYHYQWREGDRITTIYLPRKKLEAVENAIARRESVNAILMMLG